MWLIRRLLFGLITMEIQQDGHIVLEVLTALHWWSEFFKSNMVDILFSANKRYIYTVNFLVKITEENPNKTRGNSMGFTEFFFCKYRLYYILGIFARKFF